MDEEILAGADPGSSATAQLVIPVPPGADAGDFAGRLRGALPDLAQGALALDLAGQSEFGSLIGRAGRVVRVEVTAQRPADAERWAAEARATLGRLGTLADVRDPYAASQPVIEVALERDRIARLGLAVDEVADALAGGLGRARGRVRGPTAARPLRCGRGAASEDLAAALATVVVEAGGPDRSVRGRAPC
jgi:multidrug efflux pump subunit AcrB